MEPCLMLLAVLIYGTMTQVFLAVATMLYKSASATPLAQMVTIAFMKVQALSKLQSGSI